MNTRVAHLDVERARRQLERGLLSGSLSEAVLNAVVPPSLNPNGLAPLGTFWGMKLVFRIVEILRPVDERPRGTSTPRADAQEVYRLLHKNRRGRAQLAGPLSAGVMRAAADHRDIDPEGARLVLMIVTVARELNGERNIRSLHRAIAAAQGRR